MTLPLSKTAPRLTQSQQASPFAAGEGLGSNFHFSGAPGLVRSSANSVFGQGATTYIVLFATIGAASCPRATPVSNVQATFRVGTLLALISATVLYRVLA